MNEEENNKPADGNIDDGDIPKSTSLIKRANIAAQRMEEANAKREEILAREEEMYAKKQLDGTSEAGQTPKVETADEKWKREAKERWPWTSLISRKVVSEETFGA